MTTNRIYYRITRHTSQYNKYMKWHQETFREDGTVASSCHYKTLKEAQDNINYSIKRGKEGFPIGMRLAYYKYVKMDDSL